MALALLGMAAVFMGASSNAQEQKMQQRYIDQSLMREPNPPEMRQRSIINAVWDRTHEMDDWIQQARTGNIFTQTPVLYETAAQSGVDAMSQQTKDDLQGVFNDIYEPDLPLQGYNDGTLQNWRIYARARGLPQMWPGVSCLTIPPQGTTQTGIGQHYPVFGLGNSSQVFGLHPGVAPRELYRCGPVSLTERAENIHVQLGNHPAFPLQTDTQLDSDH